MLNEANALERVIDRKIANASGRRTRTHGTVSRVDADGTVYVLFDGADDDTIVMRSTVSVQPGDFVTVRVENGMATIEGNVSDPSASSMRLSETSETAQSAYENARKASAAASSAQQSADSAAKAADEAWDHADDAATAASSAQSSASAAAAAAAVADGKAVNAAAAAASAQSSANTANLYAGAALGQLGVVQDVIGVLTWASEHGSFTATQDQSIQAGKVYFTYDSQSGDYTPVVEPQASALPTYYELTDSGEAMDDFIMSHLAVTTRGLWVLPSGLATTDQAIDASQDAATSSDTQAQKQANANARKGVNYKMLLSNDGMYIYDGAGVMVASYKGSGIDYAGGRSWHVGTNDAYILYTPASGNDPASLVIGGSNVQLGDSRTLAELMAQVDGTLIYDHTCEIVQSDGTVQGETSGEDVAVFTARLYKGGVDVAGTSGYPASQFSWYLRSEDDVEGTLALSGSLTFRIRLAEVGYGTHVIGKFATLEQADLLDEDDEPLTTTDDEQLVVRTPAGDSVRVSDLSVETTLYPTEKLMVVGASDEHLVTVSTLQEAIAPSIEDVTLVGNKTFPDLGIFTTDSQGYSVADDYTLSTLDINALWANAQPIGA